MDAVLKFGMLNDLPWQSQHRPNDGNQSPSDNHTGRITVIHRQGESLLGTTHEFGHQGTHVGAIVALGKNRNKAMSRASPGIYRG